MQTPPPTSNDVQERNVEAPDRWQLLETSPILVCLDVPASAQKLISHATAMADALNAPLTLLHVLDVPPRSDVPADPVEWGIRRQEAHGRVLRAAAEGRPGPSEPDIKIAEGSPVDEICRCVQDLGAGITVVGTMAEANASGWGLGETARKLIDRCSSALFLIPPPVDTTPEVHYRRIMVPLDGSRMAERVLPLATRVARAAGAEMLLAHVIPDAELTEIGPLEADDHELRRQVSERNARVARKYVDQIRNRLEHSGLAVRGLVLRNGDVRSTLGQLIEDEQVDLLVMSAHGRSSRSDMACGGVANYMITHARTPLLVVLGAHVNRGSHTGSNSRSNGSSRGPLS